MSEFLFKRGDTVQHKGDPARHKVKCVVVSRLAEVDDDGRTVARLYVVKAVANEGTLGREWLDEVELEPWVEPACCKLDREMGEIVAEMGEIVADVKGAADIAKRYWESAGIGRVGPTEKAE